MNAGLLGFLIALVIVAIIVFPLGNALRKHPLPFYVVTILATLAYVWITYSADFAGLFKSLGWSTLYAWAVQTQTNVNLANIRPFIIMMQKGYLATVMLAVVMFCGCFDEGTPIRKKLQPIRGELSILSFIFILGHLAYYLPGYLKQFTVLIERRPNVAASIILAIVLAVIFIVLAVTSFRVIRRTMDPRIWKTIQRAAYVMVGLLAAHIALMLGRSAFADPTSQAMVSFIAYMTVIVIYAVMRTFKARRDSEAKAIEQFVG